MALTLPLLLFGCLLQGALCQEFRIFLPQTIEALKGSCVTIPCSFDIQRQYESDLDNTCIAIWIQGNIGGPVVFDSSDPQQSTIRGNLTGILTNKDCSTTLNILEPQHSSDYSLRLQCNNRLRYIFRDGTQILVKDDPPRPTLTPSTLEVREGTSVRLTCSAPAPCLSLSPTLTWTPGLGEVQETLWDNQDKTKVKTSVVNFNASQLQHRQEISCTAVYRKQDGSTESSVNSSLTPEITYPPKRTAVSVSPSGPVQQNSTVTLTCSSDANPPVRNYTWYRADGGQETVIGDGRVQSIEASKASGTFFCRAENELGTGQSDYKHIDVQGLEHQRSPCSGDLVLAVSGVALTLSILNTIFMVFLWKHRKNVKPKEEDNTYTTLDHINRTPDYDVIAKSH